MSAHAEWLTEDSQFIGGEPSAPRILEKAIVALARTFDLPEQDVQATQVRQQRWRGLRIGNLGLLVDHSCGGEIIEDAKVFALPRAANWCRGLINLRGHLVPAIDLHELIGLTHLRATRQWWLALGRSEDALAFPIDALPVSLEAQEAAQVHATLIPEALRAFTGNGHRIGGELWLEFRHGDFFKSLARL